MMSRRYVIISQFLKPWDPNHESLHVLVDIISSEPGCFQLRTELESCLDSFWTKNSKTSCAYKTIVKTRNEYENLKWKLFPIFWGAENCYGTLWDMAVLSVGKYWTVLKFVGMLLTPKVTKKFSVNEDIMDNGKLTPFASAVKAKIM